jgi:hypothetical protein
LFNERARAEAKESAALVARRRAEDQANLKLVSEERAQAEARLQSLSARRKPVLLAVSGAVLLSLLLGLYLGWRQPEPAPAAGGTAEPMRLKLETSLRSYRP